MTKRESQLAEDRSSRNAARALFDGRLAQVKSDFAARGVGGRVVDKAKGDVLAAGHEALAVVKDSKGIVAGTAAALAIWFLRAPIIAGLTSLFDKDADISAGEPDSE